MVKIKIVLLSGGSGTRLWPLSNDKHPKQLLRVLTDQDGLPCSMLQRVWGDIARHQLEQSAVIATSVWQEQQIREQLGKEADLILEPEKRDTFPAVLLAVSYLYTLRNLARDEPVVVLPVDGLVDESFYEAVFRLPDELARTEANLLLLGVKPTGPYRKYGYIVPKAGYPGDFGAIPVERFHEKPPAELAAELIQQGALWNCGVFCFRASYLLDRLQQMGLPDDYDRLLEQYSSIVSQSFDLAVVEKEARIAVVQHSGPWKDLGTWCSLSGMIKPNSGGPMLLEDCRDVQLINETDIPVVAMGLSEAVVIVSQNGILVSDKRASERLKDVVDRLPIDAAAREQRAGHRIRLLDVISLADGSTVATRRIHLEQGASYAADTEAGQRRSVTWNVLYGQCRFIRSGGDTQLLASGASAALQIAEEGTIIADKPTILIELLTTYNE